MIKDPSILFIEEEKNTSSLYKNVFNRLNINNIKTINNLLEIPPAVKSSSPDLIIIDVSGPDESRALKILDSLELSENKIPVITVSKSLNFEIKRRLRSYPKSESFVKPLDIIQFAGSVYKLLPS